MYTGSLCISDIFNLPPIIQATCVCSYPNFSCQSRLLAYPFIASDMYSLGFTIIILHIHVIYMSDVCPLQMVVILRLCNSNYKPLDITMHPLMPSTHALLPLTYVGV